MSSSPRTLVPVSALCVAWASLAAPAGAAPERTEEGHTLAIPSEHSSQGTSYYVYAGADAQVSFASDAPLEHIKGTSNEVIGYAIWNDDEKKLEAGAFVLPVSSMDTGIPLRNEHLQGSRWLDAEAHPDVVFTLTDSAGSRLDSDTGDFTMYELTLIGDMTVKGETKRMRIPATVTLLPESNRTRMRAPGDLMALRADFDIELADFGISDRAIGLKVAETLEMETRLFLSTVSPEEARRR